MKNEKFQENLSRPGIIDARARYRATARWLRNTALNKLGSVVGLGNLNYEGWNFNSGNYLFTTDTK